MSAREPRTFGDVRTSASVESMVRDLVLAQSTRELAHWIEGVVGPRVGELEAFVAGLGPDPLEASRAIETVAESIGAPITTTVEAMQAALLADNEARAAAESIARQRGDTIERLEAELAKAREELDTATAAQLVLEEQVVDLLKVEQVMIKTLRGRGLPEGDEPVTTAQVVEVLRTMGAA
jgi:hypothetical protein